MASFTFYAPVADVDVAPGPLVPPAAGFVISIALYIALFVWVAEQMRSGLKAALTIALTQFLLVNVDVLLSGTRGLETAGASAVLLFASWAATGPAYEWLRNRSPTPVAVQE